MAEYGVTDKGFVIKRYDEILKELQNAVSSSIGFDVSQNRQSMLNAALLVPFADKIASLWETAQESYYAKYPSTASGINLDNACQYANVTRESNRQTEYIIHATAVDGTVIPKNSIIATTTNPQVNLKCAAETEVSRSKCHAITIKLVSTTVTGTYQVQINAKMYAYTAKTTDTVQSVLSGLKVLVDAVSGYEAVVDAENDLLTITDTESNTRSNEVVLSTNLTTETVVGCVPYLTDDYGEVELQTGCVTKIVSNVTGLSAVTNAVDPDLGRLQESDTELRLSYTSKRYNSASTQAEAIESYILSAVDDVYAVRVYENATDTTDSEGRPPHSMEVMVDGGNDEEIAKAIYLKKSGGIYTYGDVRTDVLGKYGDVINIGFSRPELVYAWIKVEITQGSVSIPADYEDTIRNIFFTEDMSIGDSFLSQNYIAPIYAALPGIKYCDIKVATGTDTEKQTTYTAGNIDATQRQVIALWPSRIEVNLK